MNPDDDRILEALAGHADGELSADESARIESWLIADPMAREIFEGQSAFPRDSGEWQATVPMPSEHAWNRCRSGIHHRLMGQGWTWKRTALLGAAAAIIAYVGITAFRFDDKEPFAVAQAKKTEMVASANSNVSIPDDREEMLQIANDSEITILNCPRCVGSKIVLAFNPIHDAPIALAKAEEFLFHGTDDVRAMSTPEPMDAPDTPWIWPVKAP